MARDFQRDAYHKMTTAAPQRQTDRTGPDWTRLDRTGPPPHSRGLVRFWKTLYFGLKRLQKQLQLRHVGDVNQTISLLLSDKTRQKMFAEWS